MTTVNELIQYLSKLPPDAIVECGVETSCGYSTYMTYEPVDLDDCDILDYRYDKFKDYPTLDGKIFIQLNGS